MLFRTRPNRQDLSSISTPTACDIAWSAGIFEGEGTVRLCGKTKRGHMVSVVQKDPEILYRLRDWFGGSVRPMKSGCSTWDACGDRSRLFIALSYQYLSARRKVQVEAAKSLEFLRGISPIGLPLEELQKQMLSFYEEHRATTWYGSNRSVIRKANYQARKSSDPNYLPTLKEKNKQWRDKQRDKVVAIA